MREWQGEWNSCGKAGRVRTFSPKDVEAGVAWSDLFSDGSWSVSRETAQTPDHVVFDWILAEATVMSLKE